MVNKNRQHLVPAKPQQAVAPSQAPVVTEQAAAPQPAVVQYYKVIAPKRPLTGTKFGARGNLATHEALCKAATDNGGKLTMEQVVKVCTDMNHKPFANYAINRLKVVVPVVDQPAA